ncbi:esterase family protein [Streptomyces sp. FH025]|uniref:alpha/beta hydrolase n=1 Tax=Streptomyces sp. FH025 TaxID=2815937 RepID=UPI001A9DE32F|nr:alpha/beta hydrolase-fold protein [Streptomyces sp. FH025]MBO1414359.1 esterase [Streptomyces sp. FH025]
MELTSEALVNSLLALGAAALLTTLWIWPRLARQRPLPVLGRIGLLTVVQVSLLAVLALSVNNSFGFYTTWDDLLSPSGAKLALAGNENHKGGGAGADALIQPTAEGGLETVATLPKGTPEEVGRIESVRVSGKETGFSDQMFVYLPREYFDPKFALVRFPVLLALSGYPGSSLNLLQEVPLAQTAIELQHSGRMPPTVLVMARPAVVPALDTECVDVPGGPRTETWFVKDVPEAILSTYRVGRTAGSWATFGYSTGGSCALRLAMRFPNVYGSAVSLHGDFAVRQDGYTGGDLFHGDTALAQQHDLAWRLQNLPVPTLNTLIVSTRTESDYPQTVHFVEQATQVAAANPQFKVESLYLDDGGHNFYSWTRELPASLEWLGTHMG